MDNAVLRDKVNEFRNASPEPNDVIMIPLVDPIKDGWAICVRNVPIEAVMQAVKDLAMKSPQWPEIQKRGSELQAQLDAFEEGDKWKNHT